MTNLIVNGQPVSILPKDLTDFHGHSVFTTLRSKDQKLCLWSLHWQRLCEHARFFGYQMPNEQEITGLLQQQLTKTSIYQKIRIIIYANKYALTFEPYEPPTPTIYDGVTVILSSLKPHPQLGKYKTGNSLPYALALKEAHMHNAFEALLCDDQGFLVDGARTSLLMLDGHTATVLDGGLEGCMRTHVVQYLKNSGLPIERKWLKPAELTGQLLIMNSLLGVVPVKNIPSTSSISTEFVSHLITKFRMDA